VHPVTLVALVVLVVNDHLLKAAYPGLITGKLSDVAGLVLAPPLLALLTLPLTRRRGAIAAVALVGAGFVVVKAVPSASAVASAGWSVLRGPSLIRADVTDLLALPALGLAWYAWRRSARSVTLELCAGKSDKTPRIRARSRERLALAVLPLALIGVAATSAAYEHLPIATGVGPGVDDDAVILVGRDGVTATSPDGRHWTAKPTPSVHPSPTVTEPNYDVQAIAFARFGQSVTCDAGGRCFRVVRNRLTIERSEDAGATWTTVWSVSESDRERYATNLAEDARYDSSYDGDIHADLACRSIYAVPTSGVVIAACGLAGFVRGDTDGSWAMIGFAGDGVGVPDFHRATNKDILNGFIVATFGWFLLLAAAEAYAAAHPAPANTRLRSPRGVARARVVIGILASLPALPLIVDRLGAGGEGFLGVLGYLMWTAYMLLGGAAWLSLYAIRRRGFPWWLIPIAILVSVADVLLVIRMSAGDIEPVAGWAAIGAVTLVGLGAALALGVLFPRPRRAVSAA
jgi:hypothetical protein